ncbi:NUDIX hydrolase, partial [Thiotrichales bacterium HSG1]|nr:NUDIX hydrolase [Thiotrichales bacterium HSG1]
WPRTSPSHGENRGSSPLGSKSSANLNKSLMNYCSHCGSAQLVSKIPKGENLPRIVCEACNTIHYQNPKIVAGCLPVWEDKVLLCKRAIQPRYGLWTLPAGFMENNETVEQAATRETWEESEASVELLNLYTLISLPHISQVYIMFRAKLLNLKFAPGTESLDVRLFTKNEIPWENIAFRTIHKTLTHYFEDNISGEFPLHLDVINKKKLD